MSATELTAAVDAAIAAEEALDAKIAGIRAEIARLRDNLAAAEVAGAVLVEAVEASKRGMVWASDADRAIAAWRERKAAAQSTPTTGKDGGK